MYVLYTYRYSMYMEYISTAYKYVRTVRVLEYRASYNNEYSFTVVSYYRYKYHGAKQLQYMHIYNSKHNPINTVLYIPMTPQMITPASWK